MTGRNIAIALTSTVLPLHCNHRDLRRPEFSEVRLKKSGTPTRAPGLLQNSLAVDHCNDQRLIRLQSIDNPVAVDDQFAYVLIVKLRHFAACLRKARQYPRLINNALENNARIGRRIGGNVVDNGIQVPGSAARPDYSVSHLLKRFSTSSCERVPLTRASSKPRRTLSRT